MVALVSDEIPLAKRLTFIYNSHDLQFGYMRTRTLFSAGFGKAMKEYVAEVKANQFPEDDQCYHMIPGEKEKSDVELK